MTAFGRLLINCRDISSLVYHGLTVVITKLASDAPSHAMTYSEYKKHWKMNRFPYSFELTVNTLPGTFGRHIPTISPFSSLRLFLSRIAKAAQ